RATRLAALAIDQDALVRIRQHRVRSLGADEDGDYADPEKVAEELAYCRRIVRRGYPWPTVDITGKSIEEAAKEVISLVESHRLRAALSERLGVDADPWTDGG